MCWRGMQRSRFRDNVGLPPAVAQPDRGTMPRLELIQSRAQEALWQIRKEEAEENAARATYACVSLINFG